ncbi:unnamed protein product [Rotaria sp. Silwood2]|nr:unnamed protein product [Rotaria sp. Silwood2]
MNFANHKDRIPMIKYSLQGTRIDNDSEEDVSAKDDLLSCSVNSNQSDESSVDDSEDTQESYNEKDAENVNQAPYYVTQTNFSVNRAENRWRSFKKK